MSGDFTGAIVGLVAIALNFWAVGILARLSARLLIKAWRIEPRPRRRKASRATT